MNIQNNLFLIGINQSQNKKPYLILNLCDSTSNIFHVVDKNLEHNNLDLFKLYTCELEITCTEKYGIMINLLNIWS